MRAITLRQPYAHLVVTGRKRFETRTERPAVTGKILIHAARGIATNVSGFTNSKTEQLTRGAIIGWATIEEVMDMEEAFRLACQPRPGRPSPQ